MNTYRDERDHGCQLSALTFYSRTAAVRVPRAASSCIKHERKSRTLGNRTCLFVCSRDRSPPP